MYVHDIYTSTDFAGIRHFRQATIPSGLIKMEEIAQTAAHIDRPLRSTPHEGLIVPLQAIPTSPIPELPSKSIDCKDIAELVDKGVSAWQEMLFYLGDSVLTVTLAHAEMRKVQEVTTTSGLILPSEPPYVEFVGYTSTPDEIEALETMTNRVNSSLLSDSATVGNYL